MEVVTDTVTVTAAALSGAPWLEVSRPACRLSRLWLWLPRVLRSAACSLCVFVM